MSEPSGRYSAARQPQKRPGPSGVVDIKASILDAAEYLFATRGFAATSMRAIAEQVDVTPAMAHYYFGSKKDLLQAVMEQVLGPMADALAELQRRGKIPLSEFTRLMFRMVAEHPYLPQLITREVFLPGGQLQQEFLRDFAPRLGGKLPGILQREQQQGRVRADVDPSVMALLVLSLCFFPFIARPAAEAVLGVSYDPAGEQALSEHVAALLERGLQP
jgi:TetR/AcrR family transcriptional regulator